MDDVSVIEFFRKKKPWSVYKDLILDYYLQPYLAKVARLGKPVAVVDCFAGPGRFEDGEEGSPLIIARRLTELQKRGDPVTAMFIEANYVLFERLKHATSDLSIPHEVRHGDFRSYVPEIARLARSHTLFAYIDPFNPSALAFDDLGPIYDGLHANRSVETLINFPSTGFVRATQGAWPLAREGDGPTDEDDTALKWDSYAGGTYWRQLISNPALTGSECADLIAQGYANRLRERWFRYVLQYAIRERYEDKLAKYHLVFGSRHPNAVELMNRAMVKARREFIGAGYIDGHLFANEPQDETVDPFDVERVVGEVLARTGRTTWEDLRVESTLAAPCKYTDAEFNRAIKKLIKQGQIGSTAPGNKIDDRAAIWPMVDDQMDTPRP